MDIKQHRLRTIYIKGGQKYDTQNNYQFICINDSALPNEDEKYTMCEIHTIIDNKLNTIFPDKSRYEK